VAAKDLKILEVVFSDAWGGLEMNACRFTENFKALGHDIAMVTLPGSRIEKFCWDAMIPVLTMRPVLKYLDGITALRIARIVKRQNFNILHAHISKDLSTLALTKKIARNSSVVYTQRMDSRYPKKDLFHRWVFHRIDMIVTVTEQVRNHLLEYSAAKYNQTQCIYNGIDLKQYQPENNPGLRQEYGIPDGAKVVGLIGRLDRLKKQELLVQAAPAVLKSHPDTYFVLVGEETDSKTGRGYRTELERMIRKRNLDRNFILTGFMSDVRKILPLFDLTVLTTPKETFGMVVIESMAMGIPVIAARAGGPIEIIDDGVDGLLYTPESIPELSECIVTLLFDHALRKKMGRKCINTVHEKFDFYKKLVEYERLFYNLSTPLYGK